MKLKPKDLILRIKINSWVRGFFVALIICVAILVLTAKVFQSYIDTTLAEEVKGFKQNVLDKNIVFNPDKVIENLNVSPNEVDMLIVESKTGKPVYIAMNDTDFIFANTKILGRIVKNVNIEKRVSMTIKNKRILLGSFINHGTVYTYSAIKDITRVEMYLMWMGFTFLIILLLGVILNYYNTNNIVDSLMSGLDIITNSAKEINGKDLSQRIELESEDESLKNLTETLNFMLNRVEKSFTQISDFTDNVSHELKTPLTSIKSLIEVELLKERTIEEYQDDLGKILEEVNWLNEIIQKLLIFTKNPESIERYFKPVKVENMINDLGELVELLAMEKNLTVEYNLKCSGEACTDEKCVEVLGDETLLRDIFMNLISNAIKYNKEDGKIEVSSFIIGHRIGIVISDTGIGIKEENISKITDRFFREDKVRTTKKSGSGLGLSIVCHLIELHRGTLSIESVEGLGSEFTVFFDILNPDEVEEIE